MEDLLKLAAAYEDAVREYNALMDGLGLSGLKQTIEPPPRPASSPANSGYQRMLKTPGPELQQIAMQILKDHRDKPFGYSVPFTYGGVNYLGVVEEHVGGRVAGKHPGVSLFIERTKTTSPGPEKPFRQKPYGYNTQRLIGLNDKIRPLAERFIELAALQGIPLAITTGKRSNTEQARLYQQGRTTKGPIVTQVGPGRSKHNYGAAIDVAPLNEKGQPHWPEDDALWQRIGELGESVGLKWGGRWSGFKDRPHFEV